MGLGVGYPLSGLETGGICFHFIEIFQEMDRHAVTLTTTYTTSTLAKSKADTRAEASAEEVYIIYE